MTSVDAQLIEQLRYTVEDVARVYRLPIFMLGDLTKVSYNSSEQLVRIYYSGCLVAHMVALEDRFSQFFDMNGRTEWLEFDTDYLFRTEMVARIDAIAAQHQVTMATFGHAGDGNLHPTCVLESAEDTEGIARAERAFADVFGTAIELGGTITGEHGVGAAKLPYLGQRLGTEQMALLRRIKTAFDPAGILNPGKLGS